MYKIDKGKGEEVSRSYEGLQVRLDLFELEFKLRTKYKKCKIPKENLITYR